MPDQIETAWLCQARCNLVRFSEADYKVDRRFTDLEMERTHISKSSANENQFMMKTYKVKTKYVKKRA